MPETPPGPRGLQGPHQQKQRADSANRACDRRTRRMTTGHRRLDVWERREGRFRHRRHRPRAPRPATTSPVRRDRGGPADSDRAPLRPVGRPHPCDPSAARPGAGVPPRAGASLRPQRLRERAGPAGRRPRCGASAGPGRRPGSRTPACAPTRRPVSHPSRRTRAGSGAISVGLAVTAEDSCGCSASPPRSPPCAAPSPGRATGASAAGEVPQAGNPGPRRTCSGPRTRRPGRPRPPVRTSCRRGVGKLPRASHGGLTASWGVSCRRRGGQVPSGWAARLWNRRWK